MLILGFHDSEAFSHQVYIDAGVQVCGNCGIVGINQAEEWDSPIRVVDVGDKLLILE